MTPKGTALGGVRSESYWSARLTPKETSSEDQQLEDVLDQAVSVLLGLSDQLAAFYATGGALNYFVGLYGVRNYELLLSPALMQRLATAKVELQLDIYPYESAV
ncbi:hypothetical protein C0V76_03705 [Uliginosibacterium sp. TH139]|nr:hypothetical protein C0V76_03705 [Uliginosibacterium sp. TH139]